MVVWRADSWEWKKAVQRAWRMVAKKAERMAVQTEP
jgi:hypothetical protein